VSDPRIDRYNAALAKVNAVLYEVWTPIGFVGGLPRDEYETYAVRCLSLLVSGAGEQELAAYLVSAGAALAVDPASHAKQSAEAARQLMQYQREAGAIAP
jgi:endonuclease YncB( thermonuclease family)